jgi:hypothetical protein
LHEHGAMMDWTMLYVSSARPIRGFTQTAMISGKIR